MITKEDATAACDHALIAIRELSSVLNALKGKCSDQEFEQIKKAIGLSIGRIQTDVLDMLIVQHPEFDDLK